MRTGTIVLLLIAILVAAAGVWAVLTPGALDMLKSSQSVTEAEQIAAVALGWVGSPFPDDYGLLRVPGWVENRSTQKIRSATVEIQLLDEDGNKKEKVSYEVTDIAPGARKTFDINAGTLPSSRTATIAITRVELIAQ